MRAFALAVCLLGGTTLALPQNGTTIQFGPATYVPPNLPGCGSKPSTFTQQAGYSWTSYCIVNGNFTGISSGSVSGTGTGTCAGYLPPTTYCAVNGYVAPTFQPQFAKNVQGTQYNIWVSVTSVNGVNENSQCNPSSTTMGTVVQTGVPSCGGCSDSASSAAASISPQTCCPVGCVNVDGHCSCCPIVLDSTGRGFRMTDLAHGVFFRWNATGPRYAMSWTDPMSGNGWLVLPDRGGKVTDATNLFSAVTPQPKSDHPNGYLALAVYDLPGEGGNGNGWIDPGDRIYSKLRVWIDANQNGEAEPEELHTLSSLGIARIGLRYRLAEKVDQFGNVFRYVSQVLDESDPKAYDVWIALDPAVKQ